jgi:glycosyltransferase involved in cell wall biosynthesis
MKVAIDCRLIDTKNNTGISRYTEFLINYYISRFGKKNIILICNYKLSISDIEQVITTLRPFSIIDFFYFRTFIRDLKIDIIHFPFYSGLYKKLNNVFVLITVHDLMYRDLPKFFSRNLFINKFCTFYYDILVRMSLKSSNHIIAVSKTTENAIYNFLQVSSVVIPECYYLSEESDPDILIRYSLKKHSYFFYCGNSRIQKNLDFIKTIFSTYDDLPILVMAGSGHSTCKNILNVGVVTDSQLRALYENSIALIFPSKSEGFGLPVLEALRAGTQVVASRIPAFLEFNAPSIHFFDLNNHQDFFEALNSARFNPIRIDNKFFDGFSKEVVYQKMDSVLQKTLKNMGISIGI